MIRYETSSRVSNVELNDLFKSAWSDHSPLDYGDQLTASSIWVCAFDQEKLIGFVKVLSDGGKHGFVLDITTHSDYQRQGIGSELLKQITSESKKKLHHPHVTF